MTVIRGGIGSRRSTSIGLVLGAGGVVGQAYQAGVLAALERETSWDPHRAAVIVGTSAGSVTGAALRAGVPATDHRHHPFFLPASPVPFARTWPMNHGRAKRVISILPPGDNQPGCTSDETDGGDPRALTGS